MAAQNRFLAHACLWLAFTLLASVEAAAQVTGCRVVGRVTDPDGRPVAGARLELVGQADAGVNADRDGRYCLTWTGDASGPRHLLASADGFHPQTSADLGPQLSDSAARVPIVDVVLTRTFAEEVTVTALGGVGSAPPSASRGDVDASQIATRALLRPGDILGVVPGVVMTQHSSGGHAPIILLRGYNLDHGTDFATFVDDVPLNLPSHAHAQGYTDLNFLINEAIERIEFQKGPYAPQVGDFGTAGAANVIVKRDFARPQLSYEFGPFAGHRGLALGSLGSADRRVTYGLDVSHADGPNVVPDDFRRIKAMLRQTVGTPARTRTLSAYAYHAGWNATDGYPLRALTRGDISRFGTLDASDGGGASDYLVSARWRRTTAQTARDITLWGRLSDFDLFSNLTFWTRHPQQGDQIHQQERRLSGGLLLHRSAPHQFSAGPSLVVSSGLQLRHDLVAIDLFNTVNRLPTAKIDNTGTAVAAHPTDAAINTTTTGGYVDVRAQWRPWLKTTGGLRLDVLRMQVDGNGHTASGAKAAAVVSPKGNATFGPWRGVELFANGGLSFHSNHAGGVVQPVDPADPVVRTGGAELGLAGARRWLQWTTALWMIRSASELVYVPEEGTTSPERPAHRAGIEASVVIKPSSWLTVDVDVATSSARYRTDPLGEGRRIPDALRGVASGGVTVQRGRWVSSVRLRYLGERSLQPDGSVWSRPAAVVNVQLTVPVHQRVDIGIDLLNALDRRYEDITYFFATRLRQGLTGPLEPAAVHDYVTRPGEPRAARVRAIVRF